MGSSVMGYLGTLGGGVVSYIIPFLFVLTVVVFFHELGHFLVARWCGIKVLVFSIGFGPELLGFNDRHQTRWKLSAIPLGGYVKFFGDDSAASTPDQASLASMSEGDRRQSFFHQNVWRRAAVVVAGPVANFILAIVIFAGISMFYGTQITSPRADVVLPGSAAAEAGIQPGDLVVAIDGAAITSFSDMQRIVSGSGGRTLKLTVDRGGARVELQAAPRGGCNAVLGISRSSTAEDVRTESIGPLAAFGMGADQTYLIIDRTLCYIGHVIVGRESADQVGGVIRIAQVSGQAATLGFSYLINLTAGLSVSIGLLNLFPIPLLDGGHLLFYLIEAVRGRPLSERAQEMGFRVGLAIVVMLMIFATFNDIIHLWPKATS